MDSIYDLHEQEKSELKRTAQFKNASEYANKTIQTSDGRYGYVTDTGVVKPYADSSPSNRCPHEVVNLSKTWPDLNFPIGSMMAKNQSCGNEGRYVQSIPSKETTVADYASAGKVGYIDLDTNLHQVHAVDYLDEYTTVDQKIKGAKMKDCSKKATPVKYSDRVYIATRNTTGNLTAFMNNMSVLEFSSQESDGFVLKPSPDTKDVFIKYGDRVVISNGTLKNAFLNEINNLLEFGSSESLFYFQPPIGSKFKSGDPILYGNQVTVAFTPETDFTTLCGWYGCKVGYMNQNNQLQFGKGETGRDGTTSFTIQNSSEPSIYDEACDVDKLRQECNLDSNCVGFIFASKTNEWQTLTNDTQFMESADPTTIFIKKASVNLADTSCIPGSVVQIDSSLYNNYPPGHPILPDGSGQCKVALGVSDNSMTSAQSIFNRQLASVATHKKEINKYSSQALKEYHDMYYTTETKIKQYNNDIQQLHQQLPEDPTLQQHQEDNEIIRRQNQFNTLVWSLIVIGVIGILVIE